MEALGKSLERKAESGFPCLNDNRCLMRTRRCAIMFLQGCNLGPSRRL
jgi:hypothetical protein